MLTRSGLAKVDGVEVAGHARGPLEFVGDGFLEGLGSFGFAVCEIGLFGLGL